jgi:hypothetical protein
MTFFSLRHCIVCQAMTFFLLDIVLSVSYDSRFLITPSVFSNVSFLTPFEIQYEDN